MDAVLGLSVTPSAVGLVLVEGQDADGATMDGDGFNVGSGESSSALETSEQAAAAVLRTEALAVDRGHRVHSIGVTWSDDADTEASLLLKSLSDSGFDNIVPVRLSEATDALARGIAEMTGYSTTAVCVIEPEQLIALVVQTDEGAVQTAVNHSVVTEEDLVGWLSAVFTKADWEPEALVLVGSAEDLDGLSPILEDALAVPVFAPAEAQLALARGAALACARNGEFRFSGDARDARDTTADRAPRTGAGHRFRRLGQVGPAAVLAAGVVTFVASVSAALALQAAPEQSAPPTRPAADTSAQTPAAVRVSVPVRPPPVLDAVPPPVPEAPPAPVPQAEPAPEVVAPVPEEVPIADAGFPQAGLPAAPPPLQAPPPPAEGVPPGFPAPGVVPPPVPEERPGILDRIRERLAGVGDPQPPAVPPPLPPGMPPPPPPQ